MINVSIRSPKRGVENHTKVIFFVQPNMRMYLVGVSSNLIFEICTPEGGSPTSGEAEDGARG